MLRASTSKMEDNRVAGPFGTTTGAFVFTKGNARLRVQASDGGGWDHVSVSLSTRTPTWEEMCYIKSLFFTDDEVVMQLHPAKENYVNNHQFCLHLWRPQPVDEQVAIQKAWEEEGEEYPYPIAPAGIIPLPPTAMVGINGLTLPKERA